MFKAFGDATINVNETKSVKRVVQNNVGKGENLVTSNFSFSHNIFIKDECSKNVVNECSKNVVNECSKNVVNECSKNVVNECSKNVVNECSKNVVNECSKVLTLSSIYTHINTLTKKPIGNHCGKR